MNRDLFNQNKTRHFKGLGKLVAFTKTCYVFSFKGRKTFMPFESITLPDRTQVKADIPVKKALKSVRSFQVQQPRGPKKSIRYNTAV